MNQFSSARRLNENGLAHFVFRMHDALTAEKQDDGLAVESMRASWNRCM